MKKLTQKESAFVDQWLIHGSMVKAYTVAYDSRMVGAALRANAKKVGRRPHVRAQYEARRAELDRTTRVKVEQQYGINVDLIVQELAKIGFSNIRDHLTLMSEGYPVPNFEKLSSAEAAGIKELTYKVRLESADPITCSCGRASQKLVSLVSFSIRMHDRNRALIAIGKAIGMYGK
jgi:hypothetical protein